MNKKQEKELLETLEDLSRTVELVRDAVDNHEHTKDGRSMTTDLFPVREDIPKLRPYEMTHVFSQLREELKEKK